MHAKQARLAIAESEECTLPTEIRLHDSGKGNDGKLADGSGGRRNGEDTCAPGFGYRATDDGEDKAEPGARAAQPDEQAGSEMLAERRSGAGSDEESQCVASCTQHQAATFAEPVSQRAKHGSAESPGDVLDCQ